MIMGLNRNVLETFARDHAGLAAPFQVEVAPLRGGLDCDAIGCVTVRWTAAGRSRSSAFVAKRLATPRELYVYRSLEEAGAAAVAPRLLGFHDTGAGESYLFLEWIRARQ